jgi:hypothetical protein
VAVLYRRASAPIPIIPVVPVKHVPQDKQVLSRDPRSFLDTVLCQPA